MENLHHVKYGSFYANRNVDSYLTQNSKIVVGPKFMGPLQKHLQPYSLNILVVIFESLQKINVKP